MLIYIDVLSLGNVSRVSPCRATLVDSGLAALLAGAFDIWHFVRPENVRNISWFPCWFFVFIFGWAINKHDILDPRQILSKNTKSTKYSVRY